MTFKLKELSELRQLFNDTVKIILKSEGKGKIEDHPNPHRKFELQFLSAILDKLEEKPSPTANLAFYGAMYTVLQDIENNRGVLESSGLLSGRLKVVIGISSEVKAENKPDLYQIAKFHTALNAFLSHVFIEHDSRKGFVKDHMLTAIPTDNLSELIKTAYKLEMDAQKAIVASFAADGSTPIPIEYKAAKKSPASATDRFGGWDKLCDDLDELILDELADKKVPEIEKIPSKERITQLNFLKTIRASLKNATIDEAERVAILAGSMHLVRQQIKNEYVSSHVVSSLVTSEENSVILMGPKKKKGGLNTILDIDAVGPQDVEALVTSAAQYIQFMTVDPKHNGKKAIRASHIFSEIKDLNLKAVFNLLIDMIYTCRMDALNNTVEEFKKETKGPEKAPKGYLGGITTALGRTFFGAKLEEEEDEDDEEELEHKSSVGVPSTH